MLRTGSDAEGDAGLFISPSYPGHRDCIGGGKPPPPTVPPVQHADALASTERAEPFHRPVRQGVGEEATTGGGRVDSGECGEVLPGLWKTA